ncbi:MAG TPA: L,D-transpeptidase [Polyangiaceae bacterium]|nr:L,D-transpeptidase [Polyangiaceae bacterium]
MNANRSHAVSQTPILLSRGKRALLSATACACTTLALIGCNRSNSSSLSKLADDNNVPEFPAPAENGPKLGCVANATPIFEKATTHSKVIGFLHAGASVARSEAPVRKARDCESGYFAIFPRGFVCLNQGATLDMAHPTLAAMAIQPALDRSLPYTYGRARASSALLERDARQSDAVVEVQKFAQGSGAAVVGSWTARELSRETERERVESQKSGDSRKDSDSAAVLAKEVLAKEVPAREQDSSPPQRLALLTSGRFARARDLEAARPSSFAGQSLAENGAALPVAFVIKRGVFKYRVSGDVLEKAEQLEFHDKFGLTSRYRTQDGNRFWLVQGEPERWVRERDVTRASARLKLPEFVSAPGANDAQRWIDISVGSGTLVAYVGKRPVYTTLVSVGRDRLAEYVTDGAAVTRQGTFEVVAKHVSWLDLGAIGVAAMAANPNDAASKANADAGGTVRNAAFASDTNNAAAPATDSGPTTAGLNPVASIQLFSRLSDRSSKLAFYDVPWLVELSSGQFLHGAYWHDRFGIEHGPGDVALSPTDARWLFEFVTPTLPKGWHAVGNGSADKVAAGGKAVGVDDGGSVEKTLVVIHK